MNVNTSWTTNVIGNDTIRYSKTDAFHGDILVEIAKVDGNIVVTKGRNDATADLIDHATRVLA